MAFLVALAMLMSLMVPFAGSALASHGGEPTSADHDIDAGPEFDTNATGDTHTIVATQTDNAPTPTEIDFEVEGPGDPNNDGFTPETPDGTCVIGGTDYNQPFFNPQDDPGTQNIDESESCSFTYSSDETGEDTITVWVDDDEDNTTYEEDADETEGPCATAAEGDENSPYGEYDEDTDSFTFYQGDPNHCTTANDDPGAVTEPDDTDVVTKTWFEEAPEDAVLDCTPEEATNPSTGEGSSEQYTCTLFEDDNNDGDQDSGEDSLGGFQVDGENMGGPNDPDNTDATPADYNDVCTTDANGDCTFTITSSESQEGDADLCFWVDSDDDNQYVDGGPENDGGECDAEGQDDDVNEDGTAAGSAEDIDDANNNNGNPGFDQTDVVTKTWAARGEPASLILTPQTDQNVEGTSHTVTATVTDAFGDPVQGETVDFFISGRNELADVDCQNINTDANGEADCTYQDQGTDIAAGDSEQDTITACTTNQFSECVVSEEDPAEKFWFDALPEADEVILDMTADDDCGDPDDSSVENNEVGEPHEICATVHNAQNEDVPGETVTFTSDGVGQFWDDADNDDQVDAGELSDTFTTTTDEEGDAYAWLYSEDAGTQTVTATADAESDEGTKEWVAEEDARNINCDPETATNPPGTTHTVTCTVTDRFGNPIEGYGVAFTETGPGRFSSQFGCDPLIVGTDQCFVTTNSQGQASVQVTSSSNETGTQTITGRLIEDTEDGTACANCQFEEETDDDDDACEDPGSNAAGDPAGNCDDEVLKTWSTAPTTPSEGFPRSVTLEASDNRVKYPDQFTLTATVNSNDPNTPASCIQGVTVTFSRTVSGETTPQTVGTATTNANGVASIDHEGDRSATYTASVSQSGGCAEAVSQGASVLVKKKVTLRGKVVRRNGKRFVILRGRVAPCDEAGPSHAGQNVILYKAVDGVMSRVGKKRTNDECKFKFRRRKRGKNVWQVKAPKTDPDHERGSSRKIAV